MKATDATDAVNATNITDPTAARLRADAAELAELAQRLDRLAASLPGAPPWLPAALAEHAARCTLAAGHLALAARAVTRLGREAPRSAVLR